MLHEFAYSSQDFRRARQMIAAYAGISLHERKENMVYNRLARRMRAIGSRSVSEYLDRVEAPGSAEREGFVNAMTTNLTAFFREPHHFERLRELAAQTPRRLRVWSSACSTGEEAWSAAMAVSEAGRSGEIFASDIDTDALSVARTAIYRLDAVEHLDAPRIRRHFMRGVGPQEGLVQLRPELRGLVKFASRNLLAPDWPVQDRFDVVFCRNVMIYFDRETQQRLLDRFAGVLAPGGILFLGHSENCATGHPAFRALGKTAYERCTKP